MQFYRGIIPLLYPEDRIPDWTRDVDERIQVGAVDHIILIFEGPHFFDFPEFRQIVGEKEENFQHSGLESRILENIARLGASVALDT